MLPIASTARVLVYLLVASTAFIPRALTTFFIVLSAPQCVQPVVRADWWTEGVLSTPTVSKSPKSTLTLHLTQPDASTVWVRVSPQAAKTMFFPHALTTWPIVPAVSVPLTVLHVILGIWWVGLAPLLMDVGSLTEQLDSALPVPLQTGY